MFLVDTCVVAEARKKSGAHPGVREFLQRVSEERAPVFMSVLTVGELRRGIETIRHRGGKKQAAQLEFWLEQILEEYPDQILSFGPDTAQLWGAIQLPPASTMLDQQMAATARIHGLTLVTGKDRHFYGSGIRIYNPFIQTA